MDPISDSCSFLKFGMCQVTLTLALGRYVLVPGSFSSCLSNVNNVQRSMRQVTCFVPYLRLQNLDRILA